MYARQILYFCIKHIKHKLYLSSKIDFSKNSNEKKNRLQCWFEGTGVNIIILSIPITYKLQCLDTVIHLFNAMLICILHNYNAWRDNIR